MGFSEAIARAKSCEDSSMDDFVRHLADAISAAKADENSLLPFLHNWRKLIKFYASLCDLEGAQRVLAKARCWRLPGSARKARQFDRLLAELASFRPFVESAGDELRTLAKTGKREFTTGRLAVFIPSKAMRLSDKDIVTDLRKVLKAVHAEVAATALPWTAYVRLGNHGTPIVPDDVSYTSHHTISDKLNGLHFKITDRPHCYSFDRRGYSGWSAFADSEIAPVEQSLATAMVEADRASIIGRNVSKYVQPENAPLHSAPWIFVALQTANDHVQQLARIPMLDMLAEVATEGSRRGIKVVVKRHPRCTDQRVGEALQRGVSAGDFEVSKASIHSLIAGSCAVCTVNSSVGAEALLHGKPVYLFGRAEYQYACHQMHEPGDFAGVFVPGKLPLGWEETIRFLYSLRCGYAHDINKASFEAYLHKNISELAHTGSLNEPSRRRERSLA